MVLSDSMISEDCFFTFGLTLLLSQDMSDENYFIVDLETANHDLVANFSALGKKVFAFISNDIDYYRLRHLDNVTLVDRRIALNEVLPCFRRRHSRYNYHVKHELSDRENEMLTCMLEGLGTREISEHLKMNIKTFYAYRTSMIKKLQITNRIFLYNNIARSRAINITSQHPGFL